MSHNPLNIHIDGFDRVASGAYGVGTISLAYFSGQGPYGVLRGGGASNTYQADSLNGVTGRFGGKGIRTTDATAGNSVGICLPRQHEPAEFTVGIAFRAGTTPGSFRQIFSAGKGFAVSGTTPLLRVGVNASGQLQVTLADVLSASDPTILGTGSWHYVEAALKIAASGGSLRVNLDGVNIPAFDVDGDTKGDYAEDHIDGVWLLSHANTTGFQNCFLDDFYYTDGLVMWGPTRITTYTPAAVTANAGFLGDADETTNLHTHVDEDWNAANVTYVKGASTGNQILFAAGDLPEQPATINAVAVGAMMGKSDGGARAAAMVVQTQSVQAGTSVNLASSEHQTKEVWPLDPHNDTAWTRTKVEALAYGLKNT